MATAATKPPAGQNPLPPLTAGPHTRRFDFIATLGGLLFGYDTGVINGALETDEGRP